MVSTWAAYATLVILLVWMAYFTLGSLPLIILKHDTPMDARFIRGFFDVYYKAVIVTSGIGLATHVVAQRPVTSSLMFVVGAIAWLSRRAILSRMDSLRATMTPTDEPAIRSFRRLHVTGMVLNVSQLAAICGGMIVFGL